MLLLTRNPGEVIYIIDNETGKEIEIVIAEVQGNRVKLGLVDDGKNYTFLRKEVRERKEGKSDPNPFYRDNREWVRTKPRKNRFNMPEVQPDLFSGYIQPSEDTPLYNNEEPLDEVDASGTAGKVA